MRSITRTAREQGASPIRVADSLRSHPGEYFDIVLTNPPFGRKSSVTFVNEEGREEREASVIVRDDFWASTSNKQLNFVQHIKSLLKIHGRAAMVVPLHRNWMTLGSVELCIGLDTGVLAATRYGRQVRPHWVVSRSHRQR